MPGVCIRRGRVPSSGLGILRSSVSFRTEDVRSIAHRLLQLECMSSALRDAMSCVSPFGAPRSKNRVISAESKSDRRLALTRSMTLVPRWFVKHDRTASRNTAICGVFRDAFSSHMGLAREGPDTSFRRMTKRVLVKGDNHHSCQKPFKVKTKKNQGYVYSAASA